MKRNKKKNRGTATTELAVCLPVLTLVVFSSIEACNLIHVKQVVAAAAYEGALVASKRGADEIAVQNRIEDLLEARDIKGYTITMGINGSGLAAVESGQLFEVAVSAGAESNLISPHYLFSFVNVTSSAIAQKQ